MSIKQLLSNVIDALPKDFADSFAHNLGGANKTIGAMTFVSVDAFAPSDEETVPLAPKHPCPSPVKTGPITPQTH